MRFPHKGPIIVRCVLVISPLRWRHNDLDGVSNHQPRDCLLNRLFSPRSKKTSKLHVTGLCVWNSPGPVNSPHKWPVTRKMLPFDDVIMLYFASEHIKCPPCGWLNKRWYFTSIGNLIAEVRRFYDPLISTMEFHILVKWHLYIKPGSW